MGVSDMVNGSLAISNETSRKKKKEQRKKERKEVASDRKVFREKIRIYTEEPMGLLPLPIQTLVTHHDTYFLLSWNMHALPGRSHMGIGLHMWRKCTERWEVRVLRRGEHGEQLQVREYHIQAHPPSTTWSWTESFQLLGIQLQ